MKETAFWGFFGFGTLTVLLALGGGAHTLTGKGGGTTVAFGFLLIFMGVSLGFMLASLLFIRKKEGSRKRSYENKGGEP